MGKTQIFRKNHKYVMAAGLYSSFSGVRRGKKQVIVPAKQQFSKVYRPYRGQDLTNKTLLIWRTGGIGDLLFIKPNLDELKRLYPSCTIWFSCGPNYQSMVENWECVDQLLDLPFNARYLFQADYHVTFEGVIERCKEAEYENAYRLFTRWMGVNLPDDKLIPRLNPKPERLAEAKTILNETFGLEDDSFVLMQLRASSPIRCPERSVWVKLITQMVKDGREIVITDNPITATEYIAEFMDMLDEDTRKHVHNFTPYSKSLDYTVALCKLAHMVVGTDSALMHLAASMDTKMFGLYGPFPGDIRLSTYKMVDWIDVEDTCAPCYIHSERPCQYGKSKCYNNLDFDDAAQRITDLWEME